MRRTIITLILTLFAIRSIYALWGVIIYCIALFSSNPYPFSDVIVDLIFVLIWIGYFIYAFLPKEQ